MGQGEQISRRSVVSGASVGVATLVLPRAAMAASEGDAEALFASATGVIAAPASVTATDTGSGGTVQVSWGAVSAGSGGGTVLYQVRYRLGSSGTYTSFGTTDQTSLIVTGLTNGSSYEFVVVASDSRNTSTESSPATATPTLQAPGPVTNFTVTTAGSGELACNWDPPTTGGPVTSYVVQTSIDSGSTWTTQATLDSSTTSYTVTGLANGTNYTCRCYAVNATGDSSGSTTPPAPVAPAASTVETLATPAPQPPVIAVQSTFTTIDVITDRNESVDGVANSTLQYQYAFSDSANEDDWTTMSSWTNTSTFLNIPISEQSTSDTFTLFVRKRVADAPNTLRGKSSVTLRRWSELYSPGTVYALQNNSGDTRLTNVTVTARGGRGGAGGNDSTRTGGVASVPGLVTATVTLDSGHSIYFAAGGSGSNGASGVNTNTAAQAGGTTARSLSGQNVWSDTYAGGSGGRSGPVGTSGQGGSGGGASVVARGATSGTASVIIVAAGAGGGGGAEEQNGGGGFVRNSTEGGGNTGTTVGANGNESVGSKDDTGGGGGGGGGAVGGLPGSVEETSVERNFFGTITKFRKKGNGGSRGSNLVTGTGVTASTNGNASGTTTTGFVTLEYTETTAITAITIPA